MAVLHTIYHLLYGSRIRWKRQHPNPHPKKKSQMTPINMYACNGRTSPHCVKKITIQASLLPSLPPRALISCMVGDPILCIQDRGWYGKVDVESLGPQVEGCTSASRFRLWRRCLGAPSGAWACKPRGLGEEGWDVGGR